MSVRSRRPNPSRRAKHATWVALACALLALPACGAFLEGPPTNQCDADDECVTGRCDADRGMCVSTETPALRVGLVVLPASNPFVGSTLQVDFPPIPISGETDVPLQLPVGVQIAGTIWDEETSAPITADVSFTLASQIPGAPATTVEASAGAEIISQVYGGVNVEHNLATQLLPNRRYDVLITPTGDWRRIRPPIRGLFESDESGILAWTLPYPPLCADGVRTACLATIEGHVQVEGLGMDGMLVRMIDATGGHTVSSTYVSGAGEGVDEGYFQITFDASRWETMDWFLQVSPTADLLETHGPIQTFTVDPATLNEVDGQVTIRMPGFEDLQITYEGAVDNLTVGWVPDATLRFTSVDIEDDATGNVGSYSTTVRTDGDGRFSARLLRGTYDIVITPSEGLDARGELAVLREERSLGSDGGGQVFTVPNRGRFSGTVRTEGGLGMLDATVRAQARRHDHDGTLGPVALFARSSETTCDRDGLFALPLDVGVYDLVVVPPAHTNYPWMIQRDFALGGSERPITDRFVLDNPVPITGVATFAEGSVPVAGGEIRAYAVIETDTGIRAIQVGSTTTDSEGHYTLLLPPRL